MWGQPECAFLRGDHALLPSLRGLPRVLLLTDWCLAGVSSHRGGVKQRTPPPACAVCVCALARSLPVCVRVAAASVRGSRGAIRQGLRIKCTHSEEEGGSDDGVWR